MSERVLSSDVFSTPMAHSALPADEVDEGHPSTATSDFGVVGASDVGIWEMTQGVARDTEADEIFIVLSGKGSVAFEDGTTLELAPGVAVRLHAGERTRWVIDETLRKIYVASH